MAKDKRPRAFFPWIMLLLGALVAAVGVTGTWLAARFAFGQPAIGKVVAFHRMGSSSRSASMVGDVDVSVPGSAVFRAEVEDAMGSQDWEVGGEVNLRCAHIYADHWTCSADSGAWGFLFPLLFLGAGAAMVWWSTGRVRRQATWRG